MSDTCPCIECICRPICNGKTFSNLMGDCQMISDYYYFSRLENFDFRLDTINKNLHPVWNNKIKS